jgi:hypothetical protein
MIKHKFAKGDRVIVRPDVSNANMRPGIYTIVSVLPVAGRGCQYRAKSVMDTHERVLDEDLLQPAEA